ncbi:DUF4345 domain-containing protein [Agromyces sp. NPDC056379]|uniref:DUF4345 domain-containing protein n=1 Tax=unclassified Agromyces TaxID=2639701 RepID=UPI0035D62690
MTPRWSARLVLLAAGIVLVGIGLGAGFATTWFYAEYGIALDGDVQLMSELRAAGFALLLLGSVVGTSAFRPRLTTAGATIGAVVLLGYAGGRLLSWAVDGAPSTSTAVAGAVELVLGIGCASVLLLQRRDASTDAPGRTSPVPSRGSG